MTAVPTLAEMRHALGETPSDEGATPTLAEMMHANALYQSDPDAYLEHYGIKGMKWGVRRSAQALGRLAGRGKAAAIGTKDEEGNVVGGIRAASRAGAQKLKDMKEGSTLILTDAEGASKIMSKQNDGTFKEVYLSADAERVLRTTKKAPSELSDAEITAAINRSKKIEEYNKLFAPPNPNADLKARAESMELELKIRAAERALNPPKKTLVKKFIGGAEGSYKLYKKADKELNGDLGKMMKELIGDLSTSRSADTASTVGKAAAAAAAARSASKEKKAAEDRFWGGGDPLTNPTSPRVGDMSVSPSQQKRVDDYVYNITSMGKDDTSNPFTNQNPTGPAIPPYYPELERRS